MKLCIHHIIVVFVLSAICSACASVNLADPNDDLAAKTFSVADGKSNIYTYRNEDVILNTDVSIEVDGKKMGSTGPRTYILATVSPGKHTVVASGENTEKLEVTTEAGKNYFVWLEIRFGVVTNRGHLHLVPKEEGEKGVLDSKLVK